MSNHHNPREVEHSVLSRRGFLGGAAGFAAAAATHGILPRIALAAGNRAENRDVLITIFLRGGADGLSLVPAFGDPYYSISRPNLKVPPPDSGLPNAGIPIDGFFGFHPVMSPLMNAFNSGDLLIVHATGHPVANRSHFEKERIVEFGDLNGAVGTGWLARHLLSVGAYVPGALLRAIGTRTSPPYALYGAPDMLPIADPANFGLAGSTASEAARKQVLSDLYQTAQDPVATSALDTIASIDLLKTIQIGSYVPANGAVYPASGSYVEFSRSMKAAAALIKSQIGIEAIAVDLADWDTHGSQGVFNGTFFHLADMLAKTLAAFHTDMAASPSTQYTIVVMSEFGRNVKENGSLGTDHGFGNIMMFLGSEVNGGQVLAQWPGLAPANLVDGQDLDVTIDYRDLLAEVIVKRLKNPNIAQIFPGYTPAVHRIVN